MDLAQIREYLQKEQQIAASDPASPEWQIFTALLKLAQAARSKEEFLSQAQALPIAGPDEEVKEARQWLTIALETIQGQ